MSCVVNNHLLDINDYNEVNAVCEEFSFMWEEIGSKLGIKRYAIETIIVNKSTCQKRMSAMIVVWLKREDAKQPLPTWRLLCQAITSVDRTSAERISKEHQCDCTECKAGNAQSTQAVDYNNGRVQDTSKSTTPFNSSKDIKRIGSFPVVIGCLSITIVIIAMLIGWKIHNETGENIQENSWRTSSEGMKKTPRTKFPDIETRIWTAGETGADVVEACVRKLQETDIFPDDKKFMRRIAFVMSRDGNSPYQLQSDGGIWQVSQFAFEDTKADSAHVRLPKKYRRLQEKLGIKYWKYITRKELEIPMYSAIAARLYLSNYAEPIPPEYDINKQDRYWWNFYMKNHESTTFIEQSDFLNAMEMLEE